MNVLEEADSLINGERQQQYGNATESHQRIADLWAGYLGTDVTEFDVVNMMILLKVSRTRNQYHRDSYVDIAGYSALGERLKLEADGTGIPVSFEPRVWTSLNDAAEGVVVRDTGRNGDFVHWKIENGRRYMDLNADGGWDGGTEIRLLDHNDFIDKHYAPFTEVLEGLT